MLPETTKCPCKGCDKRHVGCHGRCSDYSEWSKLREKARQKDFLEKYSHSIAGEVRHNQFLRKYGRPKI